MFRFFVTRFGKAEYRSHYNTKREASAAQRMHLEWLRGMDKAVAYTPCPRSEYDANRQMAGGVR